MNQHFFPAQTASRLPLPRASVYRSATGREEYLAFYDKILARLPGAVQTRDLATRYGTTRVTLAGNRDGAPLLVLPGMSICGPAMIEFFARLGRERHLIAPDLIGQPGLSADTPLMPAGNAYGRWLIDLLNAMSIERCDMATASFGSSLALDLAAIAPSRLGRLALVMPAGLTPRLPYLTIYSRLGLVWGLYRHLPVRSTLPALARPLSRDLTPDNLDYLDIVIRQTAFWRHKPAGPFGPADLRGYREPVYLVQAENDILFPHRQTLINAAQSLAIAKKVMIAASAHMPAQAQIAPILDDMAQFFG